MSRVNNRVNNRLSLVNFLFIIDESTQRGGVVGEYA
jgi:hypothetical protein